MRIILSSNFTHEDIFSTRSHLLLQHTENTTILSLQKKKKVADLTYSD